MLHQRKSCGAIRSHVTEPALFPPHLFEPLRVLVDLIMLSYFVEELWAWNNGTHCHQLSLEASKQGYMRHYLSHVAHVESLTSQGVPNRNSATLRL